jgi:hypothetical protein
LGVLGGLRGLAQRVLGVCLKERRALWRAYKSRIGVGAEGWQVGF